MSNDKIVPFRSKDEFIKVGGLVDSSSVSLCFYGDDLAPDEITKLLGVEPTTGFKKGFKRSAKSKPSHQGGWILCVKGDSPLGPDDHLKKLINMVVAPPSEWQQLAERFSSRIFIGIHLYDWNRGFALSPEVLSWINTVGIEIDFDIYADHED